jgi:hypothetical protein
MAARFSFCFGLPSLWRVFDYRKALRIFPSLRGLLLHENVQESFKRRRGLILLTAVLLDIVACPDPPSALTSAAAFREDTHEKTAGHRVQ